MEKRLDKNGFGFSPGSKIVFLISKIFFCRYMDDRLVCTKQEMLAGSVYSLQGCNVSPWVIFRVITNTTLA